MQARSARQRPGILVPIYLYQSSEPGACGHCREGFEKLQRLREQPLVACPKCGAPVDKVIAPVNVSVSNTSLDKENLEKHGFTQYRKLEKGVYEKTAGRGPERISDKNS